MAPSPNSRVTRLTERAAKQQGPDWPKIMLLATGCENEYIKTGESSVRLKENVPTGNSRRTNTMDPVVAMQDGLPVLFYVSGSGFEQRILKVDNRLSFCYVMSVASKMDKMNMLVIPLHQVRVFAQAEAVALCKSHGISDSNVAHETAVVVETVPNDDGHKDGHHDGQELHGDVYFFIAPPWTLLKERLQACSFVKAVPKSRQQDGAKDDERMPRLDGVRLKDPLVLYMEPKSVDLEVQYLTPMGHAGGRLVEHRMKVPMPLKKVNEEILKLEGKGYTFSPVDRNRVQYVVREMAVVQSWAKGFGRLFMVDFYSFINEKVSKKLVDDMQADDFGQIRGEGTIAHCCQTPTNPDEDPYSKVYIRTLLAALKQSMELDDELVRCRRKMREASQELLSRNVLEDGAPAAAAEAAKPAIEAAASAPEAPAVVERSDTRRDSTSSILSGLGMDKWLSGGGEASKPSSGKSTWTSWLGVGASEPKPDAAADAAPAAASEPEAAAAGEPPQPAAEQSPSSAAEEASPAASPPARKSYSSRSIDNEESLAEVPIEGKKGLVRASRATQRNMQAPVLLGALVVEAPTCMSIDDEESSAFVAEEGEQWLARAVGGLRAIGLSRPRAQQVRASRARDVAAEVRASRVAQRSPQAPVLLGARLVAEAPKCMPIDGDESSAYVPEECEQWLARAVGGLRKIGLSRPRAQHVRSFKVNHRAPGAPVLLGAERNAG